MTYHNAQKYILNSPDEINEAIPGSNLRLLWQRLGNPQKGLKYLRLAGSNGKTVSAEMLISAYKQSEYSFGALTTTLRNDLRNNILINGNAMSYEIMAKYIEIVYRAATEIERSKQNDDNENGEDPSTRFVLTKQEILLSVALLLFRDNDCRFCIIESDHKHADPTIFLPPPFSVAICGVIPIEDKSEIQMIRSYICHGIEEIISGPQDQEAYKVISNTCVAVNCRLTIPTKSKLTVEKNTLSGSEFTYKDQQYKLSLCGKFQINNAIFVIELLERLSLKGFTLTYDQIYKGLLETKIPAKFEILSIMPTIIADSTHSDVAISAVCESMADYRHIIGSRIKLCLPDGPLIGKYLDALNSMDYTVNKVIVVGSNDNITYEDDRYIYCKKQKDIVKNMLDGLKNDEILLISGPYAFTLEIRYALLSKLGY